MVSEPVEFPLFDELALETQSSCNRKCPACLRQSHPARILLANRLGPPIKMPTATVLHLIDEAATMGFTGRLCLQHFNEPLQDRRLPMFASYAKAKGCFYEVYANTNGDLLTPKQIGMLDGQIDRLNIALYDRPQRKGILQKAFKQTNLTFMDGKHLITHYSPYTNLNEAIAGCRPEPCQYEVQMRMIIAYTGEMLLCCEDILGEWCLGNVNEFSLAELWYSEKHRATVRQLSIPGGRTHDYCQLCPRPNTPYWPIDRPKLSLCLIVKDEEAVLDRCLQSFYQNGKPIWDELVVCDTGSTDSTITIAQKHGARIEHFQWNDNHADARNYAESKCKGEWILWIDADEVLVEGHEFIRKVVSPEWWPNAVGFKPRMVFDRDAAGIPSREYSRQELLHCNDLGMWKWHGAVHEWLTGQGRVSTACPEIVMEHLGRPGPDRPTVKDIFAALRLNLANTLDERHLYYLLREHWYKGRYQETIALVDFALAQPATWGQQRSDMALLAGHSWKALEKHEEARKSYLRAVEEWGAWAEPYYWLGVLHYDLKQWTEGAAWFYASLPFAPPVDFFTDQTIYTWRRYDLLAVCLHNLGKSEEARRWGWLAIVANPKDPRLRRNMEFYGGFTSSAPTPSGDARGRPSPPEPAGDSPPAPASEPRPCQARPGASSEVALTVQS